MKIFLNKKSRILLDCIGVVILFVLIIYLLKDNRYKASSIYQLYARCTQEKQLVRGLFKPIDFRVDFFGMIYEGRSGNIIDDDILYFGASEKYILFFMRDVAESL